MTKIIRLTGLLMILLVLSPTLSAYAGVDDDISDFMGRLNKHYWETQPLHFYEYSAIRDTMIQIQDATVPEMKDTWTVFYLTGVAKPVDSCFSQGVPIPGSYQVNNPRYFKTGSNGASADMPQPDVGGYYDEGDNWQTWVMCVLPDGTVSPVVWEDVTLTYFSPVHIDADGNIVHDDGPSSAPIVVK